MPFLKTEEIMPKNHKYNTVVRTVDKNQRFKIK